MAEPDIFVGTLTRYYSAVWETAAARLAKSEGRHHRLFNKDKPGDPVLNPEELSAIVAQWRTDLSAKMGSHLTQPLDWAEGMTPPYFSAPVGRGGCGGILMAAAYLHRPAMLRPVNYVEDWREDPAVKSCILGIATAPTFNIVNRSLWLPGGFRFGTATFDPAGEPINLASLSSLNSALEAIDQEYFGASDSDVEAWQKAGLSRQDGFAGQIKFGFAVYSVMCRLALKHNVPMKLHF